MKLAKVTPRKIQIGLLAVLLLVIAGSQAPSGSAASPGAPPTPWPANVEPAALKEALSARGTSTFIVHLKPKASLSLPRPGVSAADHGRETVSALQATATTSQVGILAELERGRRLGQVQSYESFWSFNGVVVNADLQTLLALAARPEVEMVRANHRRRLVAAESAAPTGNPEWNIQRVRADQVWSGLGYDGLGVTVAILDTGVDWQHPALLTRYRGYNARGLANHSGNWFSATTEDYHYPGDGNGHGTQVAGIVAGTEGANRVGMAPGAQWIAAKVLSNDGSGLDSWLHAGLQWALAPGGNPALAPQIVNASWGQGDGSGAAFREDLRALRAAGILPVFAAGNSGPDPNTVNSPGSYPEALAVGATDQNDQIAPFSSRGPSPWQEIKPDVVAPGIGIRTTVPGGDYRSFKGTSAATPHVAGLAALMLQAQPGLTVTQTEQVILSTAIPLGDSPPNNVYGWGRIDAFGAVAAVAPVGVVEGLVRSSSGQPLKGAAVRAVNESSGASLQTLTDTSGAFRLALAGGAYRLNASSFGYAGSTPLRVLVAAASTQHFDFSLEPLPVGTVTGRVSEAGTGRPLAATVQLWPAGPSATADANGSFQLTLPAGSYVLRATVAGHRAQRVPIPVTAGASTRADFTLAVAPTILLVDSGFWYGDSQISYFQNALDELDYLYVTRPITEAHRFPTISELRPYGLVIWSAPQDSPGLIGADADLAEYLKQGGRLLLTGQDVAFWDAGGSLASFAPYFSDYLQTAYVADGTSSSSVSGSLGDIFQGIGLTLNTADSARDQVAPDVVKAMTAQVRTIASFGDGGGAGIRTEDCLPFRIVFLSFGWEGVGPTDSRQAWLGQALQWLSSTAPLTQMQLSGLSPHEVVAPGRPLTATFQIWNTGGLTETFDLQVSGNQWPVSLWDAQFRQPAANTGKLGSCATYVGGLRVDVPWDAPHEVTDTLTLSVIPRSAPSAVRTASLSAKTPSFVLLVDDDRWYEVEGPYLEALQGAGYSADRWNVQLQGRPSRDRLGLYSVAVWFTGYDWFDPLSEPDEAVLGSFLDDGGKLLLSSQDYLFARGVSPFALDRLGVLTYTNDITAVAVSGVPGNPISGGLGTYTLTAPFPEWSDVLTPTTRAAVTFRNSRGEAVALSSEESSGSKAVFLAFPLEGLPAPTAAEVMSRTIAWFGPLSASRFAADRLRAEPGDDLTYAIVVLNPGPTEAVIEMANPLPSSLAIVPGSLSDGATYDPGRRTVTWSGRLAVGSTQRLVYRATIVSPQRGRLVNTATLRAAGQPEVRIRASVLVPFRSIFPRVFKTR